MSLPEFGGMDTGFNYYHGADPWEYDLVLSNSEGGLGRLLELGARRAEAVFWGADPGVLRPAAGREGVRRLLLRLRRQVSARLDEGDGRRAVARAARGRLRARRARLPGRHGQRAACSATFPSTSSPARSRRARINLNITRRSHATVYALVHLPALRARVRRGGDRLEPVRRHRALVRAGQRALVVENAEQAVAAYRELLGDPAQAEEMGRRARERVLDEHTYAHRARRLLELVGLGRSRRDARPLALARVGVLPEIAGNLPVPAPRTLRGKRPVRVAAIVPAWNEEGAIGGVSTRFSRSTRSSTSSWSTTARATDTAAVARGARRARAASAVQPRDRRRRPDRVQVRAETTATSSRCALDGDGQHDPARARDAARAGARAASADIVVGSRFVGRAAATGRPFARRIGIRVFARLVSLLARPAGDGHDVGLPGAEPRGDRALRRRLPARLPRGRGDA